jgi:hypothetical protein
MAEKTLWEFLAPKIAPLAVVPLGFLVGTFVGLISDFGVVNTVTNIKNNPEMFAKQYAWVVVIGGWAAVVVLLAIAVLAGSHLNGGRGS